MSGTPRCAWAVAVALSGLAGCAVRTSRTEPLQYGVEIMAARTMVLGRGAGSIIVDSLLYAPDVARPPVVGVRSGEHQAAIDEEMKTFPTARGGDTLRLQMSRPIFDGVKARICITVVDRYGYQTVRLVFERRGAQWVVIERTQIGIS